MKTTTSGRTVFVSFFCCAVVLLGFAGTAEAQPTFGKVFSPDTIGPGSASTLTFTITNGSGTPVTDLAFTDVLPTVPGDVDIATPANASTTCVGGIVTAPDGGGTITFSDGTIGGAETCTVTVDVTASTPGVHTNLSGDLTSSAGNSGTATDDLTVVTTLPGFSKSFAPSTVPLGGRSTLTFTIDNTANANRIGNLDFTDTLPTGMVIASPNNAYTDCVSAILLDTTIVAIPGTNVITLDANGSTLFPGFEVLPVGATCTVTVDVVATGIGELDNVSGDLLADFTSAGKASSTLDVTVTTLSLIKDFTDDPVPPGGTVTLDFKIENFDRFDAATSVAFTDDLAAALPGLTYTSLLSNDCGGSVAGAGTTTITFSGGTVPPEGSCTISTSLTIPAGATPGAYTNTTGAITGTIGGSPVTGNAASDDLFAEPVPILTKEFLDATLLTPDPVVNAGDDVVLRFTITNSSTTSGATAVAFTDELTDGGPGTGFLPFPLAVTLPPVPDPPCGAGSALGFFFPDVDRQGLSLTGGTLEAAPGAGSTCTFDVTLTIPVGMAAGNYLNTTQPVAAIVDGALRIGEPASDDLTIIAAPSLSKAFTDDPVAPGGTVTLEFTLSYSPNASGDATAVTFTDDLTALVPAIAGLAAGAGQLPMTGLCPAGDGELVGSAGDTLLTFSGATLQPGENCAFSLTLDVPAGAAPGSYTNTTSGVGATVGGLAATSAPATDDLEVSGLVFSKEFLGDPVIPGDTVTLRFTISNVHPTDDATITFFTDDLQANLTGLAATGPSSIDDCGGALSGTTFLTYVGGSVLSGTSCTIEVPVLVPAGAADGDYANLTSSLSATQSGGAVTADPAFDILTVNSDLLQLTKEFTDDPVAPGDSVTLEFALTNLDAGQAASGIDFTDDLGAALTGLTFDSVLFDDCGGTVSGTGTDQITVTGASLGAGGSCTLRVSLSVPGATAANIYTNTTSAVTGTIGGFAVSGDAAADNLVVTDLLVFSKIFDGPSTATGTPMLTFTITNPGTNAAADLSFSDDLAAVIPGLVATNLPLDDVCGLGSSLSGTSFLTLTGANLPPSGGTCSIDVDLLVPGAAVAGTFPNTTSDLFQAGLPVADPATADLTIEPPPTFAKTFAPDFVGVGLSSTLTFVVDNSASAVAASSIAFTDSLPAGMVVATPANLTNTCGGTLTAASGSGVVTLTGGAVGTGATCTVTVDVAASAGIFVNNSGDLTSTSGNSGPATDTLTVDAAPGFAKVFAPDLVGINGISTLTFTIDNSVSSTAVTALDFTDNLPASVFVATPAGALTTCTGGTLTATSGTGVITYTGGSAAAGTSCTVQVDVTSGVVGDHFNRTGDLTSSLGTSGRATDTLVVTAAPSFSKDFGPASIGLNGISTMTFTIDNTGSAADATGVDFTDVFPAAIVIANPANAFTTCIGGTLTATTGTSVVTYTGGTVAAGTTCVVEVDVTSSVFGEHTNTTDDLTSSLGLSGWATAVLAVQTRPIPMLSPGWALMMIGLLVFFGYRLATFRK